MKQKWLWSKQFSRRRTEGVFSKAQVILGANGEEHRGDSRKGPGSGRRAAAKQDWDALMHLAKENGWAKDKEQMTRLWTERKYGFPHGNTFLRSKLA